MNSEYKLRFDPQEIPEYAKRYEYIPEDAVIKQTEAIQRRGYLKKPEFVIVYHWKNCRFINKYRKNWTEDQIKEATATALKTENEQRERIESLKRLDGVGWSIASVFLHFYHEKRYPIMDFRALWSLSLPNPKSYTFKRWLEYTMICRKLADENKVDMRTLDRALWQYSKENQKSDTDD